MYSPQSQTGECRSISLPIGQKELWAIYGIISLLKYSTDTRFLPHLPITVVNIVPHSMPASPFNKELTCECHRFADLCLAFCEHIIGILPHMQAL